MGNFREQVVPNAQSNQESGEPGAGNTGINTTTDTMGGAPVPTKK